MFQAILVTLILGGILGLVLGIASILFTVEEDNRVEVVIELLPGYNCGGCGYPGCAGFAEAIVTKEVDRTTLCRPCKQDQRTKIIDFLNTTAGSDGSVHQLTE